MKYQILNRYDSRAQFELECEAIKDAVVAAVKSGANLRGADLGGANLGGADLRGANLRGANLGEKIGKLKANGYFFAGYLGSRNDVLMAFHSDKGVFVRAGCFTGSLDDFRAAVIKTHGETSKHGKLYLGIANIIEYKFSEA